MSKQKLADVAMKEVISKANLEMKNGEEDIHISKFVPGLNDTVSIDYSVENIGNTNNEDSLVFYATSSKPEGIKKYSASVNAWGFTHQLRGQFAYSDGKVKSASKEVLASGYAYSHTRPSHIDKLNASVWAVQSTSVHKWLGTVGNYTGLGYTSYITINLYGSGTTKVIGATYKTGA